jgi:hypothetical protein
MASGGKRERNSRIRNFWRGSQDAFWIEGWVNEVFSLTHYGWEPAEDSSDGYPIRDWAPPLFPASHFHEGKVVGHTRGPGPVSLNSGYGSTHRSINCGVPFGKGMGVFWRVGQRPRWTRNPAVRGSQQVILGTHKDRKPRGLEFSPGGVITRHAEDAGRGSRHVAPLRRWLR